MGVFSNLKIRNIGAPKTGEVNLWAIGEYTDYHYSIFDRQAWRDGVWYGKTFSNQGEAPEELFTAIVDANPKGILHYIKGL